MEDNDNIKLLMPLISEFASEAKFIIELGCGFGNGSTRAICHGLQRNQKVKLFISVDLVFQICQDCIPKFDFWRFIRGDSRLNGTINKIKKITNLKADLIFIDTVHTRKQIKSELWLWKEIAARNCIWLFHDTWMYGKYNPMTNEIKYFANIHNLSYFDLSKKSNGLGMMYRR